MATTFHKCRIVVCPKRIPTHLLMCRDHWALVPPSIQQKVYAAWRVVQRNPTNENLRLHTEACNAAAAVISGDS